MGLRAARAPDIVRAKAAAREPGPTTIWGASLSLASPACLVFGGAQTCFSGASLLRHSCKRKNANLVHGSFRTA